MPRRSRVSIYAVRSNGSTGERKGSGALVDPGVVLVAPPLSQRLAVSSHQHRLRLGVASSSGGDVEVLEVARSTVARGAGGTLVLLEPGVRAQSPCDEVTGLDEVRDVEDLVAAGLAHVTGSAPPVPGRTGSPAAGTSEPPTGPLPTEPPPSEDPDPTERSTERSFWCRMLGVGCS